LKSSRNSSACFSSLARSGANSFPRPTFSTVGFAPLVASHLPYFIVAFIPQLQDTSPTRALHDQFMTRRRRRLLIPIIISSRASTSHIVFAPALLFPLRIPNLSDRLVPVSLSLVRDSSRNLATPSSNQKFHIIKLLFLFHLGPVRSHVVYHVLPDSSLMCYL